MAVEGANLIIKPDEKSEGLIVEIKDSKARNDISNLSKEIDDLSGGQPTTVSLVSDMTDTNTIYLYTGIEDEYTSGNWYYHDGSAWVSGGTYGSASSLTTEQISALNAMFQKCAFTEDVTTEYEAFKEAFGLAGSSGSDDTGSGDNTDETEVTLSSISATYTGGEVTVGTPLTDLTGITVTATYSDGSTKTVTDYILSGEIVEGETTITVSYGGKTTTFTVMGVAGSSGDDNEETTPLRGLQLEAFPTDYSDTDFWDYSNYGSDLANAYGGGNQIKFAYKPKLFTGTIYLRMINVLGYDHSYTTMGDIYLTDNADFFSNVASETLEKLTAEELTRQFTVDGITGLVHVSDDGITRPTNAYNNGGYEKTGSNGYVYLQKFVIPEGKYGVLTLGGIVGSANTNMSYREGWSTVFYDDPTNNITCTEVTE